MMRFSLPRILLFLLAVAVSISAFPALAGLPPLIPRAVLMSTLERTAPVLSPDGKSVLLLHSDEQGIQQLCLRDVATGEEKMLTKYTKPSIGEYRYTHDGKYALYTVDKTRKEKWHLCAKELATGDERDLTPYGDCRVGNFYDNPDNPGELLVQIAFEKAKTNQIYRMNLLHEGLQSEMKPPNLAGWLVDANFQVGAVTFSRKDGGRDLMQVVRTPNLAKYKKIYQWDKGDQGKALTFIGKGKILIASSRNSDTMRLLTLDLATGKEQEIAADKEADIGLRAIVSEEDRTVQAVSFMKEKIEWKAIDPAFAPHLTELAKIKSGNFLFLGQQGHYLLLDYISDIEPDCYYLYDLETKKYSLLYSSNTALEGVSLALMQPVSFPARDGFMLHGYLTTPLGVPAKNLPMVLRVHGGPWKRDEWRYDPVVQLLANRGYSVLQINFRGSYGYGKKFLTAGYKEWGGKMQDDLTDGVDWAIKTGIADPKRIAIMGGSYGGYAALCGLAFTPDRFVCGIDSCGPSNLITFLTNNAFSRTNLGDPISEAIGDPEIDGKLLRERSPYYAVDRIAAPLLIAQGDNDARVPESESDQMVRALRKAGKDVDYRVYLGEGHRLANPESRDDFYAAVEQFLEKYLGGRAESEK